MEVTVHRSELASIRDLCPKDSADACSRAAQRAVEVPNVSHYIVLDIEALSITCSDSCSVKRVPLSDCVPHYYIGPGGPTPSEAAVWHVGMREIHVLDAPSLAVLYRELQRRVASILEAAGDLDVAEALRVLDTISNKLDELSDYVKVDLVVFVQGREVDAKAMSKILDAQDLEHARRLCNEAIGELCDTLLKDREVLKRALGYAGIQRGESYVVASDGVLHVRGYKSALFIRHINIVEFLERYCKRGSARYYLGGRDYGANTPDELLLFLKDLRRVVSDNKALQLINGKIRVMEELIAYEVEEEVRRAASAFLRKATIAVKIANTFENKDVAKELVEQVIKVAESIVEKLRSS